jgi:hypothetical protein
VFPEGLIWISRITRPPWKPLKKYAQLSPTDFHPHSRIAWVFYGLKKYEDAISQFKISNSLKLVALLPLLEKANFLKKARTGAGDTGFSPIFF